jgi:hypothetical protein
MKWSEVRRALGTKLRGTLQTGKKHDFYLILCGDVPVGTVMVSRGSDDVKSREAKHCADSLDIGASDFKKLVACTLSRKDFCALRGCSVAD